MTHFEPWDDMLRQYVDDRGRVDYARWQVKSKDQLDQWLQDIRDLDLHHSVDPNVRFAFWINLYNALCIAKILNQYPLRSIRPTVLGIPNWIAFLSFFLRPIYRLGDRRYSLDAIEHGVLRKEFKDPRIHFALVCATIGCPLLRNEAYWPDRVMEQLEEDAQRFIQNSDKVRYDAPTQTLYCSKIFKWYRRDFLAIAPSLPAYIQQYWPSPSPFPPYTQVRYLPYDLTLNQRTSS